MKTSKTSLFAISAILIAGASAPAVLALDEDVLRAHAAKIPATLETKEETSLEDIKKLVVKQNETHTELHKRLDEVEKKGADVVSQEAIDRVNTELGEVTKKLDEALMSKNRGLQTGDAEGDPSHFTNSTEYKSALDDYLVKGEDSAIKALQTKALSAGSSADGGAAIPEELDRNIEQLLKDYSPFRAIAGQITVNGPRYKKLINEGGAGSGWVGETDGRPETGTPKLTEVTPPLGTIYANPAITQDGIDDIPNVQTWLQNEVADEFAIQEGIAFISGNGVNKPRGFLDYTTSADKDGVRAFGTLQHRVTGQAAALPDTSSNPGAVEDMLIHLITDLRSGYRQGARFLMNSRTAATIRTIRDADGRSLWQPSSTEGAQSRLLGFGVTELDHMPDVAAGNCPIAFGNFSRGYLIMDRIGTRVLRDAYTNKPYVHFYTTKRVGGGVVNSECIKLLKVAAS